jgi:hypothetical protein
MNDDGAIGGKSRATAPPRTRADPAPTAKGKSPPKIQIQYKIQYKYVLYIIHALSWCINDPWYWQAEDRDPPAWMFNIIGCAIYSVCLFVCVYTCMYMYSSTLSPMIFCDVCVVEGVGARLESARARSAGGRAPRPTGQAHTGRPRHASHAYDEANARLTTSELHDKAESSFSFARARSALLTTPDN